MPVSFKELKERTLRSRMIIEVPEQAKDLPKRGDRLRKSTAYKDLERSMEKTTIRYEDNIQ